MDKYLLVPWREIERVNCFLNSRMWPCRLSELESDLPPPNFDVVEGSKIPDEFKGIGFFVGPSGFYNGAESVYRSITIMRGSPN